MYHIFVDLYMAVQSTSTKYVYIISIITAKIRSYHVPWYPNAKLNNLKLSHKCALSSIRVIYMFHLTEAEVRLKYLIPV